MTSNSSLLLPDWSPVEPSISQDSQITIKPRDFQSHSLATTGIEPQQKSVHIDDVMELDDDEEAGSTEDSECTSRFSDDSDEEEEEVKKLFSNSKPFSNFTKTLNKSISNGSLRSKFSSPSLKLSAFSTDSTASEDSNETARLDVPPRTPSPGRSFFNSTSSLLRSKRSSPPPAPKSKTLRSTKSSGSLREKLSALSPTKLMYPSLKDKTMPELMAQNREMVLSRKGGLIEKGLLDNCEKCDNQLGLTRRIWVDTDQLLCEDCLNSAVSRVSRQIKLSTLGNPSPSKVSHSPHQSISIIMSKLISDDPSPPRYSSEHPDEVSFIQMDSTPSALFSFGRMQPGFGVKGLSFTPSEESSSVKILQEDAATQEETQKKYRPWLKARRSMSAGFNLSHFFNSTPAPLSKSNPEKITRAEVGNPDVFESETLSSKTSPLKSPFTYAVSSPLKRRPEEIDMRMGDSEERLNKHYLNWMTILIGKLEVDEAGEMVVVHES